MIMSRDVHDAVNDARTGNMSSYNALPLKECTPTSGHQIWQPNVKSGEAVCLAHQSRCKVNWSAETITKNAVGMIVRDGDPSSPPSDIFMAETAYSMIKYQDDDCLQQIADSLRPKYNLAFNEGELFWDFDMDTGDMMLYIYDGDNKKLDEITYDRKALTEALKEQGYKNPESWGAEEERLCGCGELMLNSYTAVSKADGGWEDWYQCNNCGEKRLVIGQDGLRWTDSSQGGGMLSQEPYIGRAEDPTQADASNMGGPTTPGNAGVPADVGGDDLVPYDSPSAPPAGVFMNAEYKSVKSQPFKHLVIGVAFTVSTLYFWSTAGGYVKNWIVVRVDKYAPQLRNPQFQVILTTLSLVGIIYFGRKLYGATRGLELPRMSDIVLPDMLDLDI
jgi:hypothetical protein